MKIAAAILLGLLWGSLCALLGGSITRTALKKNTETALMTGNFLRTLVDLTALGLVFLLRALLPFDYSYMLIAAAVALSLGTIIISFRIAGKK